MTQWILKDPARLQSIKLFNGILDKGQLWAAIISCPWSLHRQSSSPSGREKPWELLDIGLEVLPDGIAASWWWNRGLIELFPDGNFCCPAKGVLHVLLCAQTEFLWCYEGAGKGKEDGVGSWWLWQVSPLSPLLLGFHSLSSGMFSSLMGGGNVCKSWRGEWIKM